VVIAGVQLAAVLGQMGHYEDNRRVLIEKEPLSRRARRAPARHFATKAFLALKDAIMGITTGYARQPLLALVWILVVWGAGAVLYSFILYRLPACDAPQFAGHPAFSRMGALLGTRRPQRFAPVGESGKSALANPRELQLACFRRQPEASAYPKFNAAMLSADVIVPGLGSGQKDSWSPVRLCGQMVHAFPDSSRPRARAFGGGQLFGYRQNELIGPATSCHLIRRPDRIRQIVLFRDFTPYCSMQSIPPGPSIPWSPWPYPEY